MIMAWSCCRLLLLMLNGAVVFGGIVCRHHLLPLSFLLFLLLPMLLLLVSYLVILRIICNTGLPIFSYQMMFPSFKSTNKSTICFECEWIKWQIIHVLWPNRMPGKTMGFVMCAVCGMHDCEWFDFVCQCSNRCSIFMVHSPKASFTQTFSHS